MWVTIAFEHSIEALKVRNNTAQGEALCAKKSDPTSPHFPRASSAETYPRAGQQ